MLNDNKKIKMFYISLCILVLLILVGIYFIFFNQQKNNNNKENINENIESNQLENNNNISVGQKQRIAIARSILKDTPIILFDEVTSALDKESKKNIEETINEIAKVKTVVVIAHTLDSIDNFDNIVCLKNGVIVEEGSHNDLINEKGMYYNLLNI